MPAPNQKQAVFPKTNSQDGPLTTIEQVLNLISQRHDKVKILKAILAYALELSQAEFGVLLVVNNNAENMVVVAKQGMPNEVIKQMTKGELGRLMLSGQWVRIEPERLQLKPEQALLGRHHLKYLLGIPLRSNKDILGAIVVSTCNANNCLPLERQQQKLAALAQIVALFLDNARLRTVGAPEVQEKMSGQPSPPPLTDEEEASDELEALLEAVMTAEQEVVNQNNDLDLLNSLSSEVASTLNLNTVLEIVVRQSEQALKAELGWCYLFENGVLTLRVHRGLSPKYVAGMRYLKPGSGTEGMAFSRNELILRDSSLFHSGKARALVKAEGLHTVAAAPLVNAGEPFGVLALADRSTRMWSPRDERMLASISRQVSQAIINSKLFAESQEKAQSWEVNNSHLQQTNRHLAHQVSTLKRQLEALSQSEQQVWSILAASSRAGRQALDQVSGIDADEQLTAAVRKVLIKLSRDEDKTLAHLAQSVASV